MFLFCAKNTSTVLSYFPSRDCCYARTTPLKLKLNLLLLGLLRVLGGLLGFVTNRRICIFKHVLDPHTCVSNPFSFSQEASQHNRSVSLSTGDHMIRGRTMEIMPLCHLTKSILCVGGGWVDWREVLLDSIKLVLVAIANSIYILIWRFAIQSTAGGFVMGRVSTRNQKCIFALLVIII